MVVTKCSLSVSTPGSGSNISTTSTFPTLLITRFLFWLLSLSGGIYKLFVVKVTLSILSLWRYSFNGLSTSPSVPPNTFCGFKINLDW